MARYFIEVAYKGTAYSGFQVQENAVKKVETRNFASPQMFGSPSLKD